jgi:hypothetical protein
MPKKFLYFYSIFKLRSSRCENDYHQYFYARFFRIRDAPDTVYAGYPAGQISGYRISGRPDIRIPDIRPDIWIDNSISRKISNKLIRSFKIHRRL